MQNEIPDHFRSETLDYYEFRKQRALLALNKAKEDEERDFYQWQVDHYRMLYRELWAKIEQEKEAIMKNYAAQFARKIEQRNRNVL